MNIQPDNPIEVRIPDFPASDDQTSTSHGGALIDERIDEGNTLASQKYKIRFLNNAESFGVNKHKFCNYIENYSSSSKINSRLISIFQYNNQVVDVNDFFLKPDGELKTTNYCKSDRIKEILTAAKIPIKNYDKWSYLSPVSSGLNYKISGDLLRIYTTTDEDSGTLTIVLLDPHHLFATSRLEQYETVKGYGACMSKLMDTIR